MTVVESGQEPASDLGRDPRVVVIDNYDSFVYILVQYLGELGADISVFRNDATSVAELQSLSPDAILVSPGPGTPDDSGVSLDVVSQMGPTIPTLGVCLGHQCIGQVFGATVGRAANVMHGKTSLISHSQTGVFTGLEPCLTVTRYHSLVVEAQSVPDCLEVTATSEDGTIMGLAHRQYPIEGVQFHPESVLTESGPTMMANFLNKASGRPAGGCARK